MAWFGGRKVVCQIKFYYILRRFRKDKVLLTMLDIGIVLRYLETRQAQVRETCSFGLIFENV